MTTYPTYFRKLGAALALFMALAGCEQTTVAPTQPRAAATTQHVEVGDKIINPVPGTEQTAGRLIDWRWGVWNRNCAGAGICYIHIMPDWYTVANYPVVGAGTGFLSAPANVDPKTGQGIIRIIFTKQQENIEAEKVFTVAKEGTTLDDKTAHAFGYSQVIIQAGDYPIVHGDGSAANPFGYVDVTAACK